MSDGPRPMGKGAGAGFEKGAAGEGRVQEQGQLSVHEGKKKVGAEAQARLGALNQQVRKRKTAGESGVP